MSTAELSIAYKQPNNRTDIQTPAIDHRCSRTERLRVEETISC